MSNSNQVEAEQPKTNVVPSLQDAERTTEILNSTHTGDIVLMNRKCLRMKHKLAKALCLLHKTENRFDHAAMIVKISEEELKKHSNIARTIQSCALAKSSTFEPLEKSSLEINNNIYSPTNTYILETNVKGVTLRPAENRISRSSSNEIAIRSITMEPEKQKILQQNMLDEVNKIVSTPYQNNVLNIIPSFFTSPDKLDRINAAHKINMLEQAVFTLQEMCKQHPEHSTLVNKLSTQFESAKRFLISTYFPHLDLFVDKETGSVHVNMSHGHFIIDGHNDAEEMVCSELICNIWQRTKLTNGYVPASGVRPFDFFDNSRFNFTHASTQWGRLQICRSSQWIRSWLRNMRSLVVHDNVCISKCENNVKTQSFLIHKEESIKNTDKNRISDIVNSIRNSCSKKESDREYYMRANMENVERNTGRECYDLTEENGCKANLPNVASTKITELENELNILCASSDKWCVNPNWLIQSNLYGDTLLELPSRLFWSSALFATCGLLCAPLTLCWMQRQLSTSLLRGSVWSLAYALWSRDICFAAAQSITAYFIVKTMRIDRSEITGSYSISSLVDTRHVYYILLPILAAASFAAHIVSTPLMNLIINYHFKKHWSWLSSPKLSMRTVWAFAPVNLVLPFQAYWLWWYETIGSFVVPTPSSILRARSDLLELPQWGHWRNDAVIGAVGGTLLIDFVLYPLTTFVRRKHLSSTNRFAHIKSPWRGLYNGYCARFAGNALIIGSTIGVLHNVNKL